jgi:uncharacterized protein YjiS (DUF1127 family)
MSNINGYSIHPAHEASRGSLTRRALNYFVDQVQHFKAVNELEQLSDRQLRDIGVERRQIEVIAEREIARLRSR